MRKILLLNIAVLILAFAAAQVSAQITGAYGDANTGSKEVKRAAAFAISAENRKTHRHFMLVSTSKAEQQVVAGLNYRVCMRVREKGRKSRGVSVVVYQNLKNRLSLTSWDWGACNW